MRIDFEAAARHADRVVDALLAVHGEVPRQRVNDLPVAGQIDDLAGVDDAADVAVGDLAVFARDGHDGAVIGAANVVAGNADEDVGDVDAGHALGFLGRALDRFDRLLEIDHDAFAHSQRRRFADADDFEASRAVRPRRPRRSWSSRYRARKRSRPSSVRHLSGGCRLKKLSTTIYCGHAIQSLLGIGSARVRFAWLGGPVPQLLGDKRANRLRIACG